MTGAPEGCGCKSYPHTCHAPRKQIAENANCPSLRFETLACFGIDGGRVARNDAAVCLVRFSRPLNDDEWRAFAEACDLFAIAAETQRAETENAGSVEDEDAGPQDIAQPGDSA